MSQTRSTTTTSGAFDEAHDVEWWCAYCGHRLDQIGMLVVACRCGATGVWKVTRPAATPITFTR